MRRSAIGSLAVAGIAATAVAVGTARARPGEADTRTGEPIAALTDTILHWITRALEFGGIAVIVLGVIVATGAYLLKKLSGERGGDPYDEYRASLGRSILLGLEFLVAADIINTVAIEPTLDSVVVLGGIVLIRTFLSFALEVEIEGRWPWQNHRARAGKQGDSG
ncbi:DUF1622 domain-containing protein [Salinarimonas rosea]|uniref:DUF1622 domain-containing protein n=1 Tax=Salinarimonas rosea TaxID=552063 RepID=UPI0004200B51|nr:DUF1622 domain-containing protein [Salinarimonas rosea]